MVETNEQKIKNLLEKGVEQVEEKESLKNKLLSRKQLRVKFGIDPTASDLHLGHAVVLRKLRQFQDLGHKIILLIGDFTATIGDPSGKSSARPPLAEREVINNMRSYLKQADKIINIKKAEIRYNSEWFGKMKMKDFYSIAKTESVKQLAARSMFRERMENKELLTLSEFTYPLLQGYDSVKLKVDVELGGHDQIFNLLHARRVQKRYGIKEQDILTVPLLEGTDGVKKMSKSLGNYIALNESSENVFGKIMSIPDGLILKYVDLLTGLDANEIKRMPNPRDQKAVLAKEIVKMCHGEKEAQKAEKEFNKIFRDKEIPTDIKIFQTNKTTYPVLDLLFDAGLAESKSEAKRLVEGGGVTIEIPNAKLQITNKRKVTNWKEAVDIEDGIVVKVGKRKFIKIKLIS